MTAEGQTITEPQKEEAEDTKLVVPDDERWLIRESDFYHEEYKECTSFRGRFHQYFIYGESLDCNQWKKDYDNSRKWENNKDCKAGLAVIKSEKERRLARLRAHYKNDTWTKRDLPPDNWDTTLPEWMVKRDENTYLAAKSKEIKEGIIEQEKSFCSIM